MLFDLPLQYAFYLWNDYIFHLNGNPLLSKILLLHSKYNPILEVAFLILCDESISLY